ncbi:hypothetical protein AB833_15490 [Chromatiales bacterium (ex Bugula neritina AB1)]|nr:hypothetical protein AB833_15490 [Chromatiales bacterium (ex Bugula neritina AB1)]
MSAESTHIAAIQAHLLRSPFHRLFSPEVIAVDHETLSLTVKAYQCAELERQPGTDQWHGGAIAALVDTVGCYALTLLGAEPLPTINFRTDYLRPAIRTDLFATAVVRQAGRSVGVVDVDINNSNDKLIALGRASYSMTAFNKAPG